MTSRPRKPEATNRNQTNAKGPAGRKTGDAPAAYTASEAADRRSRRLLGRFWFHRKPVFAMYWSSFEIRQLRKALGLTEHQLAGLLGFTSDDVVYSLEEGDLTPPASLCLQFDELLTLLQKKHA